MLPTYKPFAYAAIINFYTKYIKTFNRQPLDYVFYRGLSIVRQKVLDAMLDMGKTDKGQEMLAKIPVKQIGPAAMSDYSPLKDMKLERFYQHW